MSRLEIRLFGDPVLRQHARTVTEFDNALSRLAEDMLVTMRDANGVGLAAPQVGILKQLFTWEVDEETGGAVVNPVLEDASEETITDDEGCLSFPGLFYPVARPLRVRVRHQDLHGDERVADLEAFLARVWLHEMDHLNGILFIDHLAKHDRREAMRRMRELREGGGAGVELRQGGPEGREGPEPGRLLLGRQ